MPRKSTTPPTRLGQAIQARRGAATGYEAAAESGLSPAMLYAIEQDRRRPGAQAARALAAWLGPPWTTDDVLDAARQPPGEPAKDQDTAAPVVESPPVPVAPAPVLPGVRDRALELRGRVLQPWAAFGGLGLRRQGAGLIVAAAGEGFARNLPGQRESYVDDAPNRTAEARADAIDAWLLSQGATLIDA